MELAAVDASPGRFYFPPHGKSPIAQAAREFAPWRFLLSPLLSPAASPGPSPRRSPQLFAMLPPRRPSPECAALLCLLLAAPLPAHSLQWDPSVSAGQALGGTGTFSPNFLDLFWWDGTANVPWTDTAGRDTAVLSAAPDPAPSPPPQVLSIPENAVVVAKALTFDADGYTLAGPGSFLFRNGGDGTPTTLTVPLGRTGRFTAANHQDDPTLPAITLAGGGLLEWGPASQGTKIILTEGTTVLALPGGSRLGRGTQLLENGTYRLPPNLGNLDSIDDRAAFSATADTGLLDLNGSSETIGSLSGNLHVTNQGLLPATLSLAASGTATFTGVIADGPQSSTSLTLTSSPAAPPEGSLTAIIGRAQRYSGDTTLRRGCLRLAFNHPAAADTPDDLLYHAAPQPGRLLFGSSASSADRSRALLDLVGAPTADHRQRFSSTQLEPWATAAITYTASPAGSFLLQLGDISRSLGSSLNIASLSGLTAQTPTGTADAIVADHGLPWLTIAGSDWAFKDPTNTFLVAPPLSRYDAATDSLLPPGGNVNLPSGTNSRLHADTSIQSLRLNLNERRTLALGGHTLAVSSILLGSALASSGVSLQGGILTSPASELLFIHQANASFRYSGLAATLADGPAGPLTFTKSGSGATFLTGNNTFSGTLHLAQGTLIITGDNAPSSILVQGNAHQSSTGPLPVQNSGITLLQLGHAQAHGSLGRAPITLGPLASFAIKRSDSFTLPNPIDGAGHFQHAGTGTTTLSGPAHHYAWRGDTTLSAGVLNLDNHLHDDSKIPDTSPLRLAGGTLRLSGGHHLEAIGQLDLSAGASSLERAPATLGHFRLHQLCPLDSPSAAGATLNFADAATAATDTSNTNGILGAFARLTVGGTDWARSAPTAANTPITAFQDYRPLDLTPGQDSHHSLLTASAHPQGSHTTHSLKIDASAAALLLELDPDAELNLTSGGLLFTGAHPIVLQGGFIESSAALNPELILHNYATSPVTLQSSFRCHHPNTPSHLTISGPGHTILRSPNYYGGITYLNGGRLSSASSANLGGAQGTLAINASATNSPTVTLASSSLPRGFGPGSRLLGQTVAAISGTTLTLSGNATTSLGPNSIAAWATGNALVLNRATLHATATFSLTESNSDGNGGTATLHRPLFLHGPGATLEVDANQELTLTGPISGPGGLDKSGPGTLVLANPSSGNFTATGPTNILQGTLRLEGASNGLPFNSDLLIAAGATVDLNGLNHILGSLSGRGTLANHASADATATVGTTFSSTTFSGSLQDGPGLLALTKTGSGTLHLTSPNFHRGPTLIEAGILSADNPSGSATGSGPLSIAVAGTLSGAGHLDGPTSSSGTIAPGSPTLPGLLTFNRDLTCLPDSLLIFKIGGTAPADHDRLRVAAPLYLAPAQEIRIVLLPDFTPAAGDVFPLVASPDLHAPDLNFTLPALPPSLTWDTDAFPRDGTIAVVASPNSFAAWSARHFTAAELADPSRSSATADPDHDGLANAIEFAADSLPQSPTSDPPLASPQLTLAPGPDGLPYVTLTFIAGTAHLPALAIEAQATSQLDHWPDTLPLVSATLQADGRTALTFRSEQPATASPQRFYRLRFTLLP